MGALPGDEVSQGQLQTLGGGIERQVRCEVIPIKCQVECIRMTKCLDHDNGRVCCECGVIDTLPALDCNGVVLQVKGNICHKCKHKIKFMVRQSSNLCLEGVQGHLREGLKVVLQEVVDLNYSGVAVQGEGDGDLLRPLLEDEVEWEAGQGAFIQSRAVVQEQLQCEHLGHIP